MTSKFSMIVGGYDKTPVFNIPQCRKVLECNEATYDFLPLKHYPKNCGIVAGKHELGSIGFYDKDLHLFAPQWRVAGTGVMVATPRIAKALAEDQAGDEEFQESFKDAEDEYKFTIGSTWQKGKRTPTRIKITEIHGRMIHYVNPHGVPGFFETGGVFAKSLISCAEICPHVYETVTTIPKSPDDEPGEYEACIYCQELKPGDEHYKEHIPNDTTVAAIEESRSMTKETS